jgi:GAF domain-containing protein
VTPDPDELPIRSAVADLGLLPFAEHSLDVLLRRLVETVAPALPGLAAASVTVLRQGHFATAAASDPVATDLDLVQYRHGGGPCVVAATAAGPVSVPDVRADGRWPAFTAAAVQRGVLSVLSHPLSSADRVRAGLNLYATAAGADDRRAARVAAHAVVPVANAFLYRSAVERAEHLEVALDSRGVIDQAKGILMERFKLTADQAFQALARMSMERNVRVREVAERLVRTGEFPEP